jgi:hypothetical protein
VSAPVDLATGTAGRPQRVGLATDLVLVHKVFRRELRLLPALVGAVPAGRADRAVLLAGHYRDLATALRHHHHAEQHLLLGRLAERAPLEPAIRDGMQARHRRHEELLDELEAMLGLWTAAADLDVRDLLVDILTELADGVTDHLDLVEQRVLPAVDRHFSNREWLALGLRAASWRDARGRHRGRTAQPDEQGARAGPAAVPDGGPGAVPAGDARAALSGWPLTCG